jgi:LCP family protein required for cell wall assembly
MEEHKRFRRPKKPTVSLDGIVSDSRFLGEPAGRSYTPNRGAPTPSMDNFIRRAEGFNPMRQSPIMLGQTAQSAEAVAVLDQPIVLDDLEEVKPRRARHTKKRRLRFVIKRSIMALLALGFIGGLYMGAKLYITQRHLFHGGGAAPALAKNIDINQLKGEGDGRVNILLLGVGGPGHDAPDLSDTIMLASIDPINHKAALLSLPRDLWVRIPGDGYQKVNAAYAYGKNGSKAKTEAAKDADGINLVDQTLENVLGIPIHYHAVVNFKAFQQIVDSVGGVDAYVSPDLTARENFWVEGTNRHYSLNVPTGQQHFDGTKALYFSRERHNDSDFVRSQRQRLMLTAIKSKIFNLGTFSNPVKMSNLLNSLGNNVYTDFSLSDLQRIYHIAGDIPSNQIASLDLVTQPHDFLTTGNMNGLSIVEPKTGLFDYSAIQNYVRNSMRDGFLAKENSSLAVYNATAIEGLAAKKADELKSFGYSITTIDNAPHSTNPSKTTVVDLTKGRDKYTRHYLEKRFHVSAVSSIPTGEGIAPPTGTNFVIILGKDAGTAT